LQVIHWFNPLLWFVFNRIRADREIACDSYVLSLIKEGENGRYGNTIIDLLEYASRSDVIPGLVGIVEDKNEVKRRITMIAEFKNSKYAWPFLATALCLVLGLVSLTDAEPAKAVLTGAASVVKSTAPVKPSSAVMPSHAGPAGNGRDVSAAAPIKASGRVFVALNPLGAVASLSGKGDAVSIVMQAELAGSQMITLVDREQLNKALGELKLNMQGMLAPESASKIGKIVGAHYFCSGSLIQSGDKTMAVVKVIETETTLVRLDYTFLAEDFNEADAGKTLAGQAEKIIAEFERDRAEQIANRAGGPNAVKEVPADWSRPSVMVIIPEMHLRQAALIDPAAETEITKRLLAANFKVIDSEYVRMMKEDQATAQRTFRSLNTSAEYAGKKGVDILLYGEAVSERAATLGEFEGCRGRIELKAVKVVGEEIILADSAEGGATDLAEAIAGKKAIQQAANRLADTFLYALAEKWNPGK
jgi:hypothetical protein